MKMKRFDCKKCSHFVNYDGVDRCTRFHDSVCENIKYICDGEYFICKDEGVSLYALRSWLNRLSKEELGLPLVFEDMGTHRLLLPLLVIRTIGKDFDKWVFHSKDNGEY